MNNRGGIMKRNLWITIIPAILILLIAVGCNNLGKKPIPEKIGSSQNAKEASFRSNKNVKNETIKVIVEVAKPRDITRYIYTSGITEGITDITMKSQVNGTVEELYKQLGDWINKGESIGKIDNIVYEAQLKQAEANLMSAQASYNSFKLQMKAAERLHKQKAISENEYISTKSNLQKAEAALKGAEASLKIAQKNYNNSKFISPVDGYITDLPLKIGETITAGSPVANIVNSKKLIVNTGVGESDILYLHKGQTVMLNYRDKIQKEGQIIGVGISKKNNTATYPVKIEVVNSNGRLFPGMVVTCKIYTQTYRNVFYTSEDNLIRELDQTYLYTVTEDNRAKKLAVTTGKVIEGNVIIKEGLKSGMRIVTDGIENLSDGTPVQIKITREY